MKEITEVLSEIEDGRATMDELLPLVYDQLRQLAAARMSGERLDHTLQATALVHEAYLRISESADAQSWENRGHFFAAAAESMRRILIDSARKRQSLKRGGERQRVELDDYVDAEDDTPELLLDLEEGLQRLAEEDEQAAALVKLRVFAGLSVTEAGKILKLSRTAAYENWEYARSYFAMLHANGSPTTPPPTTTPTTTPNGEGPSKKS